MQKLSIPIKDYYNVSDIHEIMEYILNYLPQYTITPDDILYKGTRYIVYTVSNEDRMYIDLSYKDIVEYITDVLLIKEVSGNRVSDIIGELLEDF